MSKCIVPKCGTSSKVTKLFLAPYTNPTRWEAWCKACRFLKKLTPMQLQNARFCPLHFFRIYIDENKKLTHDAIPLLNIPNGYKYDEEPPDLRDFYRPQAKNSTAITSTLGKYEQMRNLYNILLGNTSTEIQNCAIQNIETKENISTVENIVTVQNATTTGGGLTTEMVATTERVDATENTTETEKDIPKNIAVSGNFATTENVVTKQNNAATQDTETKGDVTKIHYNPCMQNLQETQSKIATRNILTTTNAAILESSKITYVIEDLSFRDIEETKIPIECVLESYTNYQARYPKPNYKRRHIKSGRCIICRRSRKTDDNPNFVLLRFPLDPNICRIWVKNTGIERLARMPIRILNERMCLCSDHFAGEYLSGNSFPTNCIPTKGLLYPPLSGDVFAEIPVKTDIMTQEKQVTDGGREIKKPKDVLHEDVNQVHDNDYEDCTELGDELDTEISSPIVETNTENSRPIVGINIKNSPFVKVLNTENSPLIKGTNTKNSPFVKVLNTENSPQIEGTTTKNSPFVKVLNTENSPLMEGTTTNNSPFVKVLNTENSPLIKGTNTKNSPFVKVLNTENSPLIKGTNTKNSPFVKVLNTENSPLIERTTTKNSPFVKVLNTENIPLIRGTNTKNSPFANVLNTENSPLIKGTNTKNSPFVKILNTENITLIEGTNTKNSPLVKVLNTENNPLIEEMDTENTPPIVEIKTEVVEELEEELEEGLEEGLEEELEEGLEKNSQSIQLDDIDTLFLSYAGTFKKLPIKLQTVLKLDMARLFARYEMKQVQYEMKKKPVKKKRKPPVRTVKADPLLNSEKKKNNYPICLNPTLSSSGPSVTEPCLTIDNNKIDCASPIPLPVENVQCPHIKSAKRHLIIEPLLVAPKLDPLDNENSKKDLKLISISRRQEALAEAIGPDAKIPKIEAAGVDMDFITKLSGDKDTAGTNISLDDGTIIEGYFVDASEVLMEGVEI